MAEIIDEDGGSVVEAGLLEAFEATETSTHTCPSCSQAATLVLQEGQRPVAIYCPWCRALAEPNDPGWPEDLP